MKENGFTLKKTWGIQYPTDADYTDDLALFTNTPAKAKSLLYSLYMNANKTEREPFPLIVANLWN